MATLPLTISRLAASAQVNVETVRYYQRRGLLREPTRPSGGIRRYGADEVSRLQFIRRAQAMGFSLDEIGGLLELKGQRTCESTRQLAELKLADVRRRMAELQQLQCDLEHLVAECSHVPAGASCPTLDRLERPESPPAAGRGTRDSPGRDRPRRGRVIVRRGEVAELA